jgi:uncharacterized repeat protein (TIGR01451 family)
MDKARHRIAGRGTCLGFTLLGGLLLLAAVLFALQTNSAVVHADPIDPPAGYPKLSLSVKTVTPTLAHAGGVTLHYAIEIHNTGGYTAAGTMLTDGMPDDTTYNDDMQASVPFTLTADDGELTWEGDVGFDSTVVISFSVSVSPTLVGKVRNVAVISHPLIAHPVTATAETIITDQPILTIEKTSTPPKPGANRPLTYTILIANQGQPAISLPITLTDRVPASTTPRKVGVDGISGTMGSDVVITWTRTVTLDLGETTEFTFSVDVSDVPSGTMIANADYQVASPQTGVKSGELYTVTVVDPVFMLSKHVWPDPPGSNREMTYTLTLLNVGSLATDVVITDRVPAGVEYQRGGSEAGGIVSWMLPSLDSYDSVEFTYTVRVGDVMGIPIVNDDYAVRSAEGVRQRGDVLTSVVYGPTFETMVVLDPIAKKPGAGTGPVTPTLVARNLGPGSALDAMALLQFGNINVSFKDLIAIPPSGSFSRGADCGENCFPYVWIGPIAAGETITFTTSEGQNTTGGTEGTIYTATIIITDSLGTADTSPVVGVATGKVTHLANLIPTKSAPPVVGRGQLLTYTIQVWNSALSTDEPPLPWLVDVVPISTTLAHISGDGVSRTLTNSTVISWMLPAMGTGARVYRSFSVRVDNDLVSGTQIVNDDYRTYWYELEDNAVISHSGESVTTTVQEVGLIDSYKQVTPTLVSRGSGNILTYSLHIVNSSPLSVTDVTIYDLLPWQFSTYQRDALATAGQVISDIVSVRWTGDVGAFSSEVVTLTVLVDPDYQGAITNTAIISHPSLLSEVVIQAVAFVTDRPVLRITKSASPDPVEKGADLLYTIRVVNLGQQATSLVITDTVPADTEHTAGGNLEGDQVRWTIPVLEPSKSRTFAFQVTVGGDEEVVNSKYAVRCAEGVVAAGAPVVTRITRSSNDIYLPLILRNAH